MEHRWRKSSYSGNDADCVELALAAPHALVRDSKNPNNGSLKLPTTAFTDLIRVAKSH
ncbi:DUF397 domain-containing protein [Actinokineospora sp.]|uniref:DUF397 domain-containing protein n=1 Tax=Actinokineospora sp. TaxID=1872133 RepID=UPI003D6AFAEF